MKKNKFKSLLLFSVTILIIVSSCKYYVHHNFRQTYEDYNAFIHRQDWVNKVIFLDELKKINRESQTASATYTNEA